MQAILKPSLNCARLVGRLRPRLLGAGALALVVGLGGCATQQGAGTTEDDEDRSAGPTVYGQIHESVDSVSIKNVRVR